MNWITPHHFAAEDRPHTRALHLALVRDLFERSRIPVVLMLGSMGLFYALLRPAVPNSPALRLLFPALVAVTLGRVLLVLLGGEVQGRRQLGTRFSQFFAGAILSGLLLGAINLAAFPHLDPGHLLLLCLALMGISSLAVVSMAGSPFCYVAVVIPGLGSLVLAGALHPPFGLGYLFATVIGMGLGAYLVMSVLVHGSLCKNVLLSERLADLALHDPLTGLRNRRYLQEFMQEESPRVLRRWLDTAVEIRSRRSISLILLDLDFFKRVNDEHGHAAGDAVLLQVSHLLREVVRKPDLVLRWGGEEFLILALDSDRTAPPLIAVRIHERMAQHTFILPGGQPLRQTCSVGYGIFPFHPERPEGLQWEQVFRLADESLYRSKDLGRNQIHGILPGEGAPEAIIAALAQAEPDFPAAAAAGLIQVL